jgi:hypothetical protein
MDKTRTPLSKWFMAMFLLSGGKRGRGAEKAAVMDTHHHIECQNVHRGDVSWA